MVGSCLLSKDELLTLDIYGVWHFEFLEGGLKIQKSAKVGLLFSGFYFLPRPP